MNPYIKTKNDQYEAIRTSIQGLQDRAAAENRDLTEDELRSVKDQGEKAKAIADELTLLGETETRNAKVAELASGVAETRATSTTTAKDRDPGHYRTVKDGGKNSFFADLYASKNGDQAAVRRLDEHNRALTLADEGPGLHPPHWMTNEFADIARQGRRVASAVRNIPISDGRTFSFPYQSAEAGTVAKQTDEETSTAFTDGLDTAVTNVSPKAYSGGQKVTRQFLDSATPAIDQIVWDDLLAAYDQKIEAAVVAAMVTAAGSATVTYATEAAWTTGLDPLEATYVADAVITTATAVRNGRKLPADILVCSVNRYADFLKLKDSIGRPLVPFGGNTVNVVGVGSVAVDGVLNGLGVIASDGVTQYPESLLVARASDTLLLESSAMRFSYEQPDGPEVIRLGIWAYAVPFVKRTASVERIAITAAA